MKSVLQKIFTAVVCDESTRQNCSLHNEAACVFEYHCNEMRRSLEYFDKDETMVAHLAGGVDAVIKVSQGWPISNSPLKLISLTSSDHYTKGSPSSFLSKVKERVNSMAMHICKNISSFVDAIENILMEQIQLELDSRKNDQ
ncbi:hypothetical protein TIFTF001_031969 [Ficus carica]|uniref:Uncharacterized protein n=1 Tax=Ficus carica TaxID=3494 RepID=A0AA88J5W7_FICCA|nr:hypothetical protein TIFTF001_031969 [Ficus carica]